MRGAVIRQRFSTANKKALFVKANPQIDGRLATRVTLIAHLYNHILYVLCTV